MKKYIFEKGKWDESEMFYAYSPACADRATFRQEESAIVNGKGNSFFGYEMIPMFETKKRSKGMLAQADCLFESFGAPLIVITNDITKDKSGYFVYGQYFEVVAYEKGINIWFVKPNKEGAECPIDPTLLATKEFAILPNTRSDIKMQIEGNLIKGWVNGEYLEAKADNLPDEFYVGITACEGINRFYSFTVQD